MEISEKRNFWPCLAARTDILLKCCDCRKNTGRDASMLPASEARNFTGFFTISGGLSLPLEVRGHAIFDRRRPNSGFRNKTRAGADVGRALVRVQPTESFRLAIRLGHQASRLVPIFFAVRQ